MVALATRESAKMFKSTRWIFDPIKSEPTTLEIWLWWEKRLISYNVFVAILGIGSLTTCVLLYKLNFADQNYVTNPMYHLPFMVWVIQIFCNLFYCSGAFIQFSLLKTDAAFRRRSGPFLFKISLLLSLALQLLPTMDYIFWRDELKEGQNNKKDYALKLFQRGTTALDYGDYDAAVKLFTQELKYDHSDSVGHFLLGQSLRKKGKMTEALTHYRSATELDPDYGAAWFGCGEALASLGKISEAAKAYSMSMKTGVMQDQLDTARRYVREFDTHSHGSLNSP